MDTSETYIKMCEKAEEMQKVWKPSCGDWHWHFSCNEEENHADVVDYDEIDTVDNLEHIVGQSVWLPHQDQLQGMIDWNSYQLTRKFAEFVHYEAGIRGSQQSMEQLWLAFVMKEKYNKVWDGNDWRKEELSYA